MNRKIYLIIAFLILTVVPSYALEKKVIATNQFLLNAFSTTSRAGGITGLVLADVTVKIECIGHAVTTVDESGDTWAEEGLGTYSMITNDAIATTAEDECRAWIEGQGTYASLIAYAPIKFKSAANIESDTIAIVTNTLCDISASTSGTSFTIASCTDHQGNSITPGTDSFVASYMKAYTNGGSDCNVVGESVFVSDLTSNVVTVKTADMPGSGFSATPNTSNCGIIVTP